MAMRARLRRVGTTRPVSSCERKLAESPVWRPSSTRAHRFFQPQVLNTLPDALLGDEAFSRFSVDTLGGGQLRTFNRGLKAHQTGF